MKPRLFDSTGNDGRTVHRALYQQDCGDIHAIGNGEMMLYGRGPEWMQCFGAPYSCPTLLSLVVPHGDALRCTSRRREGAGSWHHELPQGEMVDAASAKWHCIARRWQLHDPVRLLLDAHGFPLTDIGALLPGFACGYLLSAPATAALYNDYPIMRQAFMLIGLRGGCAVERRADGLMLTLSGEGTLTVVGGQDYPLLFDRMRAAAAVPFTEMLADADEADAAFLAACAGRRGRLREHPLSSRMEEATDDALMMIRAQQHVSGGIQAGHNYHLAYVRDQYGDSRGLLAMGAYDSARAILRFYREIFSRHGFIANAQAMGVDGVFHVHENDRSEITGYLLLQATDDLTATGDDTFFRTLIPMCDWALHAQIAQLRRDMMPFNGDETYIAGGIVPRAILNHGSFEATLLFIVGGTRYLDARRRLAPEDGMEAERAAIASVAARFDTNFLRGDGYVINAPRRMDGLEEPSCRHGVCMACGRFGWTHRAAPGMYVCAACAGASFPPEAPREYNLKSALLTAPFIGASMSDSPRIIRETERFLSDFRTGGRLPSLPGGRLNVGYDFGLLLLAAARSGLEADSLLERMLDLQDACGAWPEYFEGDLPQQTRCRPWESAINICGGRAYLRATSRKAGEAAPHIRP